MSNEVKYSRFTETGEVSLVKVDPEYRNTEYPWEALWYGSPLLVPELPKDKTPGQICFS